MFQELKEKSIKDLQTFRADKVFTNIFNKHFVELLEEKREERDTSWWIPEKNAYHVSHVIDCLRKSFLKRTVETELDESSLKNFELGHEIEEKAAKSLAKIDSNIENDYRIRRKLDEKDEFKIKGETDPVERDPNSGEIKDMFEIKSTSYLRYAKEEAKDHHFAQVNAYMGLLGLNTSKIIYIDKKDYSNHTHIVSFDKEKFEEFKERARKLHEHVKKDKIPEAEPQTDWECDHCKVKHICQKPQN